MDFDSHVLRPRHRQKAERRLAVGQHQVGRVLHHHDPMPLGELDHPLIEIARGQFAGRAVRIAQHQQLGTPQHVGWNRIQVRQKIMLGHQR